MHTLLAALLMCVLAASTMVSQEIEWVYRYPLEGWGISIVTAREGGYLVARAPGMDRRTGPSSVVHIDENGTLLSVRFAARPGVKLLSLLRRGNLGYFVVGLDQQIHPTGNRLWVAILDSAFDVLRDSTYGETYVSSPNSVRSTADSGFVIAVSRYPHGFSVMKFAFDGTHDWTRAFGPDLFNVPRSIRQISDGGYAVVGDSPGLVRVIRLDAEANLMWATRLRGHEDEFAGDIVERFDGGLLALASYFQMGGYTAGYWLNRHDGKIERDTAYPREGVCFHIEQSNAGGYLLTTAHFGTAIMHTNELGHSLWDIPYDGIGEGFGAAIRFHELEDGRVLVLGAGDDSLNVAMLRPPR